MSQNNFIQITSINNDVVKDTVKLQQKKYRKEASRILLEGEKSVFGALEDGVVLTKIFSTDENILKDLCKNNAANNARFYLVNSKVMEKISTVKTASNLAAVGIEPKYETENILKKDKLVLIDNIKDAGNLGTVIRSACAFNMDGILLFGDCVDEFSSKVIRSSAGNIFKIPVIHIGSDIAVIKKIKKSHKIISTVAPNSKFGKDAQQCDKTDYNLPCILVLGSEASGICEEILSQSDIYVTLETRADVESLNLAVFAGIMFYIFNSKISRISYC